MNVSLTKKLQLYRKQLHEQNARIPQKFDHDSSRSDKREQVQNKEIQRAADALGASIRHFDDQFVLVHTECLPLSVKIGPYTLNDLKPIVELWQSDFSKHPLSARGLRADDLLFFDTETTGLGSGTGQMIFLIGWARVTCNGLELKQYFLPGPGHEAAFYDAFLKDCGSLKNLVTFNGKAFDWPRVKTRHQFVRNQVPKLPAFGHFDLLHASRRLWKKRLESVRLQTIETEILSMERHVDVPGKMAPFLYFQFLKHPDAELVKGIIEHNRKDVLTLVSLYIHLSNKILGKIECDTEEQYEIARWSDQLGNHEKARQLWEILVNGKSLYQNPAKVRLAELFKREGNYADSLDLFQCVIREYGDQDGSVCIEAAKLLEHRFKDYEKAIHYTQKAIDRLHKSQDSDKTIAKTEAMYVKRLNRLDQKRCEKFS
jgi:uncharacterized protein YprB with RNaseH-like and TPR domain